MMQCDQHLQGTPEFSVIIPVYNDWAPLARCLESLERQSNPPSFEVVVVDDGSLQSAPEGISKSVRPYALTLFRQAHAGIPAARNRGVRLSRGNTLLFVDADCRLAEHCLASLDAAISQSPQHDCFQLRLIGNASNLVGRAEELRLATFQELMLQPDARIRYLNTAGFAIRRSRVKLDADVFNPVALRAEDTLLLANLMQVGELPLFVPDAIVEHVIPLSLAGCLRKDLRSAYLEGLAYEIIAAKGIKIRLTHQERLRLLWSMWRTAGRKSIGRSAWFVVVARQAFQRTISFLYRCLRPRFKQRIKPAVAG